MSIAEYFEQQGFEKGIETGMQIGIEPGRMKANQKIVGKLLASGMPVDEVAKIFELHESEPALH